MIGRVGVFEMYFSGRNLESSHHETVKGNVIDPQIAPWNVGAYNYSKLSDNGRNGGQKRRAYFAVLPSDPNHFQVLPGNANVFVFDTSGLASIV